MARIIMGGIRQTDRLSGGQWMENGNVRLNEKSSLAGKKMPSAHATQMKSIN